MTRYLLFLFFKGNIICKVDDIEDWSLIFDLDKGWTTNTLY